MSFIRKIKRKGKTYLAEVENRWVDGKVVQKHIRYIGKEVDGDTVLSTSVSEVDVKCVKVHGPFLLLHQIATEIGLEKILGKSAKEILSLVYAHCLDYKSINQMESWYKNTDLNSILKLEGVTERKLLDALDFIENTGLDDLQNKIFDAVKKKLKINDKGVVYDVTNTYLYGDKCPLGKKGRGKDKLKVRPIVQIGLCVTKKDGIPIMHRVFDGNINDVRTFQEILVNYQGSQKKGGLFIFDRGITSEANLKGILDINWDVLCGVPFKSKVKGDVRSLIKNNNPIDIKNRIKTKNSTYYVSIRKYKLGSIDGWLALCFNEDTQKGRRESRYDEIDYAQNQIANSKSIKPGMEKLVTPSGNINRDKLKQEEELDGYSCIFCTKKLTKEELVKLYLEKDLIERAFKTLKGIAHLKPIRHWLYNRVKAHIFICYLSYLILSILGKKLKKIKITPEKSLQIMSTMYNVYLHDPKKELELCKTVALTKEQELILKTVNKKLLNS